MKVMVVDSYNPDTTPKYTWKWEKFKFWKYSHWFSFVQGVYREDDDEETLS